MDIRDKKVTADDLIQAAHDERNSPYPASFGQEAIRVGVHGALEFLIEGNPRMAAVILATLLDTMDNAGRPRDGQFYQ